MMPLSRRGLTAAILPVCLTPVAGQPKERDIFDPMTFWRDCWFLCWGRRAKPPATHEVEVQAILDAGHNQAAGSPAQRTQAAAQSAQPEAVVHSTHVTVVTGAATPQVTVPQKASSVTVPGRDSSSHGAPSTAGLRQRINRPDLQQQVYVTPQGTKYHNNRCGDLARSRRLHPSGITTFSRQEAQAEATLHVETVAVEIIPPCPCAEHGNTSKAVARISRDPSHGGVLGCIAYS